MNTLEGKKYTIQEVVEIWQTETPHFEGSGPHRYEGNFPYCLYCLRPKNFKLPKEK